MKNYYSTSIISTLIAIEICKSFIKKLLESSTSTTLLATKTYCLQYILCLCVSYFNNLKSSAMEITDVHKTEINDSVEIGYLLQLPKNYDKKKSYPLLLFLHGAGERGENIKLVKVHGPFNYIEKKQLPVILLAPQCRANHRWNPKILKGLLDEIMAKYNIDKTRLYLTGLSLGGNGCWRLVQAYPNIFSAVAPVCGWGDIFLDEITKQKNTAFWLFHGDSDPVISHSESIRMANQIKKGGIEFKMTTYKNTSHNAWTATYKNPEFYNWLLSKKLKELQ